MENLQGTRVRKFDQAEFIDLMKRAKEGKDLVPHLHPRESHDSAHKNSQPWKRIIFFLVFNEK